jgi:hypothetical protein
VRVFLDANVLFSASNSGSNIARLIEWLVESGTAVSSDLAVAEAKRNLELKRPQWLGDFAQLISRVEVVRSAQFPLPVTLAAKDIPLLCAAIAAQCQFFATGDKRDFGHLDGRTVLGVQVVSLVRLARLLAERSRR